MSNREVGLHTGFPTVGVHFKSLHDQELIKLIVSRLLTLQNSYKCLGLSALGSTAQ